MLVLRKRGQTFHADLLNGRVHEVRGSLGTRDHSAALRLKHRLEIALSEGSKSEVWLEVRTVLPRSTYSRFASFAGVKESHKPTWNHLREAYQLRSDQRVELWKSNPERHIKGSLSPNTAKRYTRTLSEFDAFLGERELALLEDITKSVVESFKIWRVERIKRRKECRGATGLALDVAILHAIFAYGIETEMIAKNPVLMMGRPGEEPTRGAQPFSPEELSRLRDRAGDDLLIFLLLRHSGLRGSDAVDLTWKEVRFDSKEIDRVTRKRKKRVILPIHTELLFALQAEHDRREPQATDRVLLNPSTGEPLSRPRLYQRMVAVGTRAGVSNAHPHRFRDTLAVDMLLRGATPYDVAKTLGDTIETVERHYAPFVKALRDRVRAILEAPGGLEQAETHPGVTPASQLPTRTM